MLGNIVRDGIGGGNPVVLDHVATRGATAEIPITVIVVRSTRRFNGKVCGLSSFIADTLLQFTLPA